MIFRILNILMALLFAFAVLVQYNDPDPARWMAIYAAAFVVAAVLAVRGSVPVWAPSIVGLIALVWTLDWALRFVGFDVYAHMFDAWEMKSAPIEEARETSGLIIVTVWMGVVLARQLIRQRSAVTENSAAR